ncbi:MAG: hypothetical protein OER86_00875 [Phycisphaerae bacterium]|nr:hypothetical protein [Phycisphaerae bacterium]
MNNQPDSSSSQPGQLVLVKKQHRWVFRYEPGEEAALLRSLADSARDPDSQLDWFDAAVLSHQLRGQLQDQLKKLMAG